jgi:ABC-type uncharacterized transport system permease subunit
VCAQTDAGDPPILRKPVPGRIFRWVKVLAWIESVVFAGLLVVWLAPGLEHATFLFGLAHGIGYIALCLLILYATVRRESPWPLLAASLTPAGPFGTLIGIELIERRGWGIAAPPRSARGY